MNVRQLSLILLLACVCFASGCTARVTPPKEVQVAERVWLLQFPIHPSLVFQSEPGHYVMYEYGEWEWFAQRRTHWSRVFPVFLWPTQGSLSRRELILAKDPGTLASSNSIRRAFMADQAWAIDVEKDLARALLQRLQERYQNSTSKPYYRADLDTWFVKDPASYHALRTCHETMTAWLRELNCTVRGLLWTLSWTVQGSPDYSQQSPGVAVVNAGK